MTIADRNLVLPGRAVTESVPVCRTSLNIDATTDESLGLRVEIVRTEERLVAFVKDPAKADAIYQMLARLGDSSSRQITNERTTPARSATFLYVLAGFVGGLLVFASVCAAYLFGAQQRTVDRTSQQFYFGVPRPSSQSQERASAGRGGSPAMSGSAAAPKRTKRPETPLAEPFSSGSGATVANTVSAGFPSSISNHAELAAAEDARSSQGASTIEDANSKEAASRRAYSSGRLQTWSADGENGFVMADLPPKGAAADCKTLILWRSGAAQGETTKSVMCPP